MGPSSYNIQIGEKLQSLGELIETPQQEVLSKLEGLQDSLQTTKTDLTTQTDLIRAVQSELGRFKNLGAIVQAFNMVTDPSVAHGNPLHAGIESLESPLHCSRTINNQNPCHHRSSGLIHAVEWRSNKYHFPIGTLQVEHVESVDVDMSEGETASVQLVSYRSRKIRFIFEPPRWFSSLILRIDIAMQIAEHGCTPSVKWGSVANGRSLKPLLDELHQLSNLTLDRKLLAIAAIGELDHLFEV